MKTIGSAKSSNVGNSPLDPLAPNISSTPVVNVAIEYSFILLQHVAVRLELTPLPDIRNGPMVGITPLLTKVEDSLPQGDGVSSILTATCCNKMKEYSIATFTTGVDEIFGANGSKGEFSTES